LRDRISEFEARGARVIAIAPDTLDHAQAFFQGNDIPFTCLADPDRAVFRQYDVKSTLISLGQRPGLFVIDRQGVVASAYLGAQQWEIPSIDDTLAELDRLPA
jgi:peroxiredoxin Q/BCP